MYESKADKLMVE